MTEQPSRLPVDPEVEREAKITFYKGDLETIKSIFLLITNEIEGTATSLQGRPDDLIVEITQPISINDITAGKLPPLLGHDGLWIYLSRYSRAADRQNRALVLSIDQLALVGEQQALELFDITAFLFRVRVPGNKLANLITGIPEDKMLAAREFAQRVYDRRLSINPNSAMSHIKEMALDHISVVKAAADMVRENGGPAITSEKLDTLKTYGRR